MVDVARWWAAAGLDASCSLDARGNKKSRGPDRPSGCASVRLRATHQVSEGTDLPPRIALRGATSRGPRGAVLAKKLVDICADDSDSWTRAAPPGVYAAPTRAVNRAYSSCADGQRSRRRSSGQRLCHFALGLPWILHPQAAIDSAPPSRHRLCHSRPGRCGSLARLRGRAPLRHGVAGCVVSDRPWPISGH